MVRTKSSTRIDKRKVNREWSLGGLRLILQLKKRSWSDGGVHIMILQGRAESENRSYHHSSTTLSLPKAAIHYALDTDPVNAYFFMVLKPMLSRLM